jgi:hypothetical protein
MPPSSDGSIALAAWLNLDSVSYALSRSLPDLDLVAEGLTIFELLSKSSSSTSSPESNPFMADLRPLRTYSDSGSLYLPLSLTSYLPFLFFGSLPSGL